LRNAKARRSLAEVQILRESDEIAKLAQLHDRLSCGLDNTRLLISLDTLLAIRMSE
jgi:hypothetical protein